MNKHLKLILTTFTKQQHPNDCGTACLESIIKYAGLKVPAEKPDSSQQISLLRLHKMAEAAGLSSTCVKMDLVALKDSLSPCILHVINDAGEPHFIVHYPTKFEPGMHLIGDPDKKLELMPEPVLLNKWASRAALYIEDAPPKKHFRSRIYPWSAMCRFNFIPGFLCISVPVLNVAVAFLGLAITLVVQKAVEPQFVGGNQVFFILLLGMLAAISFAKSVINYFKHRLLINAGLKVNSKLSEGILRNTFRKIGPARSPERLYLSATADLQKIQQAMSLLVGVVLADGLLVLIMFAVLYFYQPFLILIQAAVFFLMLVTVDKYLPLLMIYSDSANLSASDLGGLDDYGTFIINEKQEFQSFNKNYKKIDDCLVKKARSLSELTNKINFSFEVINGLSLILTLSFSIYKLHATLISYETFLMVIVISYGMGMLMTRVCNQLFTIAHGADKLRQNFLPRQKRD